MALINAYDFFETPAPSHNDFNATNRAIIEQIGGQAPSKTNLLIRSQEFSNAAWQKTAGVTVVSDAVVAPDNTTTADRVIYDGTATGTEYHRIYQSIDRLYGTYVNSIWIRADTATTVHLRDNASPQTSTTCNLTTSWQRFQVFGNYTGNTNGILFIYSPNNHTPFTIYVWGGQVEPGNMAGVYAITTSTAYTSEQGLLYTQLPGNLDSTNISASAGFTNRQKAEPFSYFFVRSGHDYETVASPEALVQPIFPPFCCEATILMITVSDRLITVSGGKFKIYLNGALIMEPTFSSLGYGPFVESGASTKVNIPVRPGDILWIDPGSITYAGSMTDKNNFYWSLYCKTKHVR